MSNLNKIKVFLGDEAVVSATLEDRITVPTQRVLTDAGQMLVPCKFARTGSQTYLAKQVFRTQALLDQEGLKPDDVVTLHRDEDTVFDPESMETFRSAPVTLGHPKDEDGTPIPVTAENAKELQVGVLEGMPVRDEDTLGGTLVLTAQEAIDALEDGTQELSAGYGCDIVKVDGKYYQRNVRANHIAIVPKGRAGANCRIADEDNALLIDEDTTAKLVAAGLVVADGLTPDAAIQLVLDALEASKQETAVQKELVVDYKQQAEKAELESEKVKVELNDAKIAAQQDVIERCEVIEQARLIADMRDLGSKSIEEIRLMVVEDQMPEKDFTGKSPEFVAAMFELLGDAAKGETPMGKLIRQQDTHLTVDAQSKPAPNKADEARKRMIARSHNQSK